MGEEDVWDKFLQMFGPIGEFTPCLTYFHDMDFIILLLEDIGYVSDSRPGGIIELLYHPQEQQKLVGIKINCASALVTQSMAELLKRAKFR
jgi:hypothetical protein